MRPQAGAARQAFGVHPRLRALDPVPEPAQKIVKSGRETWASSPSPTTWSSGVRNPRRPRVVVCAFTIYVAGRMSFSSNASLPLRLGPRRRKSSHPGQRRAVTPV